MKSSNAFSIFIVFLITAVCTYVFLQFDPDDVQKEKEAEMAILRESFKKSKITTRYIIDSMLHRQGRIFLYTNDNAAKARWVPNLPVTAGSFGTHPIAANAFIENEFIKHKDSLGFILLINRKDNVVQAINDGPALLPEKTAGRVYFMGYDAENQMPKHTVSGKNHPDLTTNKFFTTWSIGFNNTYGINEDSMENPPLTICIEYFLPIKGFCIYMAAGEKDNGKPGLDSSSFIRAVRSLNKIMIKKGLDTSQFRIKTFSR